jgi:hypothetical protein
MADEMKRSEFFEYMKAFEARLQESVERLDQSMKVQFEATRGLIKFSLEAVAALRETTEGGFADMRAHAGEQTTLLTTVVTHVRERVERLESRRD